MRAARTFRRASYALEFALVLPLLLTLFAGLVDLGEYMHATDTVVSAVGSSARYGSTLPVPGAGGGNNAGVHPVDAAETIAAASWGASGLGYTAAFEGQLVGAAPDQYLQLTGTVQYSGLLGFLQLPTTITYTHQTLLVNQ